MANFDLDIKCSGPEPGTIYVSEGDTVKFINNTDASVELKFTDPDAFKPKKTKIDIDPYPDSKTLTIGGHKKATDYKWKCPKSSILATRTGRIDPS
jgi:plastocyanin